MAKRPSPELVKYIEKHLAKGFKIRHIKKKLAEVGHPIEAIEDAAAYVTASKPKTRKKIPKSMVIYGVILILIIAGFAWFIWFKATQQIEYEEKVEVIKKNATYKGMTDVQLIKFAKANDDMEACNFIDDHNVHYACMDKYWERDDCLYELFIGEYDSCMVARAKLNRQPSFCRSVEDEDGRLLCFEEVFEDISETGTPSECAGMDDCLDLYFEKHNLSLDVAFCDMYAGDTESRDGCLLFFASKNNNESICQMTSLLRSNWKCKSMFFYTPEQALKECANADFALQVIGEESGEGFSSSEIQSACFFHVVSNNKMFAGEESCRDIFSFVESNTNPKFINNYHKIYKDTKIARSTKEHHEKYLSNPYSIRFFECDV